MFNENADNNTQTLTQDNPVVDDPASSMSPVYPDTPATDTPMVIPGQIPSDTPGIGLPNPVSTDINLSQNQGLITIKKNALEQLFPLVDHLDQKPEEKFKTLLMMIQASDDQSMIQTAYEIAQQIPDEKLKAQALLDVVNEINYFTQKTA